MDKFSNDEVLDIVTKGMSKDEKEKFNSAYKEYLEQYAWNIEDLRRGAKIFADVYNDNRKKDELYDRYEQEEKRWEEVKKKGVKSQKFNPSMNHSGMLDENNEEGL
ncbi:MAG: hypothetical protein IKQ33_02670 [Clostridia bacterium]|nr:hypothetical protein [Clostridia bacterium]